MNKTNDTNYSVGIGEKERIQVSQCAELRRHFQKERAQYSCGQTRAKDQRLPHKLTRGDFCGKRWFPY